eukprot:scaffold102600_cov36-Cyclotella_meneghiniana.AAC.2
MAAIAAAPPLSHPTIATATTTNSRRCGRRRSCDAETVAFASEAFVSSTRAPARMTLHRISLPDIQCVIYKQTCAVVCDFEQCDCQNVTYPSKIQSMCICIFANVHDLLTSCSCSTSLAVMPPMLLIRNNIEAVNNKMFVGDSVAWGAYRDPTICIIEQIK